MTKLDRAQLIEMLHSNGTVTAIAAADDLRANADFTVGEDDALPGEHLAKIYERRRRHAEAIDLDVRGLDEAIASFKRTAEVGAIAFITGSDRLYSAFLSSGMTDTVVACLSTPVK